MKIIFVTGVYPPRIGGPSIQTHRLARLCRARGWDVRVLTFSNKSGRRTEDEIIVETIRDQGRSPASKYASTAAALGRLIRERKPDLLVHQTGVDYLTFVTGLLGRRHRIPVFVKHAGDLAWERLTRFSIAAATGDKPLHQSGPTARLLIAIEKVALSLCRRIWSLSPEQTHFLEHDLGISAAKIFTHRNLAVMPDVRRRLRPQSKHLRLLTVSRLIQRKNLDVLVRAIPLLNDRKITLNIVGGGYEEIRRKLESLIQELNLHERVHLAGEISPLEMARHCGSADVFVLPSIYEHFPLAAAEAMAYRLPVVASRVWGIGEAVVHGKTGFLVEAPTSEAFAERIDWLDGHRSALIRMARTAAEKSKLFDIDRYGTNLLAEYEKTALGAHDV